jgi:hypothetical protein
VRYWLDWLLREVLVLAGLNVLVAGIGIWALIFKKRLVPSVAVGVALLAFVGLSVLNVASARRHAQPGSAVLWPMLAVYEVLAAGAACAIWSLGRA